MLIFQNQYSYRAIELLLSHLDKHKNSEAEMRASVVEMISASVSIATGGSIGKISLLSSLMMCNIIAMINKLKILI